MNYINGFNKMSLNDSDVNTYIKSRWTQSDRVEAEEKRRNDEKRRAKKNKFDLVIQEYLKRGESVERIHLKIGPLYKAAIGNDPLKTIIYFANKYNKSIENEQNELER